MTDRERLLKLEAEYIDLLQDRETLKSVKLTELDNRAIHLLEDRIALFKLLIEGYRK